ncbi:hypothetical protein Scep_004048 [Stephania cephalantha]|uniref:Uncharacterized protein n=1 Tax=Stephania cephalantha TaxID=152367 RepID=A0AAP0KTA1_9MAGN
MTFGVDDADRDRANKQMDKMYGRIGDTHAKVRLAELGANWFGNISTKLETEFIGKNLVTDSSTLEVMATIRRYTSLIKALRDEQFELSFLDKDKLSLRHLVYAEFVNAVVLVLPKVAKKIYSLAMGSFVLCVPRYHISNKMTIHFVVLKLPGSASTHVSTSMRLDFSSLLSLDDSLTRARPNRRTLGSFYAKLNV